MIGVFIGFKRTTFREVGGYRIMEKIQPIFTYIFIIKLTPIDGGIIPNAVPLPVLEFVTE